MASQSRKQRLKKNLAIATMAASLGVSLGVPVGDVLADGQSAGNPPGITVQQKEKAAPNVPHFSNQGKIESRQDKWKADQTKVESTQKEPESSQTKTGYKVEPKPEQNKK